MKPERSSTGLIVDDELRDRETLAGLLAHEGYRLEFATTAAEAMARLHALDPDVVISDVMMPGMDGFTFCRRVRNDPVLSDLPIILVTALDDSDSRLIGIEAGADDFLTKPFDRAELRARLRTVTRLNRRRRLLAERARLSWVLEHSRDGYILVDADDVVQYANEQARTYLDLLEDRPAGRFRELATQRYQCVPEDSWASWPAPPAEGVTRLLVRPETATAQDFWLHVEVGEVEHSAQSLVRLRDVTSSVTTQRSLRAFHSVISHKLNTPLNHILGSLETLHEDAGEMSASEIAQFSRTALAGARRLHQGVEQVLTYVGATQRPEVGVRMAVGRLPTLAKAVAASLKLRRVHVAVASAMSRTLIPLSEQAAELILWQLLENALRFHPQQNPTVEIAVERREGSVALTVKDDGVTLTPQQLEQAWTPYYQGEKYFVGEAAGMGLGLSLVALMVWRVGGHCRLRNRDVPGVLVELTLPQVRGESASGVD